MDVLPNVRNGTNTLRSGTAFMRLGRLREKCTMLCMTFADTMARKLEKKYYAEEKTNQINKGDLK